MISGKHHPHCHHGAYSDRKTTCDPFAKHMHTITESIKLIISREALMQPAENF